MPTTEVKGIFGCTDGRAFTNGDYAKAWQTIVNYFEDETGRLNSEYKKLIKSDLNTIKYFIIPVATLSSELVWGTGEKAATKQAAISAYIKYHNLPLPTYMGAVTNNTSIIWEKENNHWVNLTNVMNRITNISTKSTNSNTNFTIAKYYLIDCLHADRDKDKKYSYKVENRQPLYASEEKELIAECKTKAAEEARTTASNYATRLTISDTDDTRYTELTGLTLSQPSYEEPVYGSSQE